jgi:PAS domain-containing protein
MVQIVALQPVVFALILGALITCVAAFILFTRHSVNRKRSSEPLFLIRNGFVIDSSDIGTRLLQLGGVQGAKGWADVREVLANLIPDLPVTLPSETRTFASTRVDALALRIVPNRRGHRISLTGLDKDNGQRLLLELSQSKLAFLMRVTDAVSMPIWKTDQDGTVNWCNKHFQSLVERSGDEQPFDVPSGKNTIQSSRRYRLFSNASQADEWYEVHSRELDSGNIFFAQEISALMRAEDAQRNFVQTLAKTFAYLPTGIAIFDRKSQLVLFNPALLDLTELSAEFLSNRPTITTFFDQLRELRIMPEPKRYVDWRQNLERLISDAQKDRFRETWTLPGGLTYRITGRPHPDGAVAFLLEDISAEVSLTRKFRAELEMTQAVMDADADGLIVFDNAGRTVFSNLSYRQLWDLDPDGGLEALTVLDVVKALRKKCDPTPFWSDLRDFTASFDSRAEWDCELTGRRFGRLIATVTPLSAGATVVRFRQDARRMLVAGPNDNSMEQA